MKTATFYIDQEYKDSVEDLGFKTEDISPHTFKIKIENVDPNAISHLGSDWGDIATYYGLQYESIVYFSID
jgi:hypothetical protein|tara:strand:- start:236 stop:448 length:213 start_codon:yes stop_codon:yes gene_type:complete